MADEFRDVVSYAQGRIRKNRHSTGYGSQREASIEPIESLNHRVIESLKNQKVSRFQGFKVSRFQGFKVSIASARSLLFLSRIVAGARPDGEFLIRFSVRVDVDCPVALDVFRGGWSIADGVLIADIVRDLAADLIDFV